MRSFGVTCENISIDEDAPLSSHAMRVQTIHVRCHCSSKLLMVSHCAKRVYKSTFMICDVTDKVIESCRAWLILFFADVDLNTGSFIHDTYRCGGLPPFLPRRSVCFTTNDLQIEIYRTREVEYYVRLGSVIETITDVGNNGPRLSNGSYTSGSAEGTPAIRWLFCCH